MKIEVEIPKGYKPEWVNGVLTLVQDKKEDLCPVIERVKTFEDALAELDEDDDLVQMFRHFESAGFVAANEDFVAYLKLRIITAALNEGWKPQFTDGENRYYPWLDFYREDVWHTLPEDFKRERGVVSGSGAFAGFVGEVSAYAPTYVPATLGSHLCYKSQELAMHSVRQFAFLWLDFCYLPNTKCKLYINE